MLIIDYMRDVVVGFYMENYEYYDILFWRYKSGSFFVWCSFLLVFSIC